MGATTTTLPATPQVDDVAVGTTVTGTLAAGESRIFRLSAEAAQDVTFVTQSSDTLQLTVADAAGNSLLAGPTMLTYPSPTADMIFLVVTATAGGDFTMVVR
jgi:hypothetical protein